MTGANRSILLGRFTDCFVFQGMHCAFDPGRLPVMNGDRWLGGPDGDTAAACVLGGRYRLMSQVGAGGMAVVWQAYDSVLARTVAVKVLATHYASDPESWDLIRHEARAAAALSHPNIAQVYDYGEADVGGDLVPYVVMELIRGGTLQRRLDEGPVLPRYAMRVCAEIAAALVAAHTEGLVHRDIKPANVMLAPTGVKVVDFGIAAAIRPPGAGPYDFEVFGTPAYLAPERLLHDAVEPASDVYALGVLLYRLLTGHSPWTSETTTQMLTAHIYLEPAPLMPMFQVPEHVTALCNRCLDKDPARRPSAREVAALLAHAAGLQVITDEPVTGGPATDPEPSVLIRAQGSAPPPAAPPPAAPPPAAGAEVGASAAAAEVGAAAAAADGGAAAEGDAPASGPVRGRPRWVAYAVGILALVAAVAATWLLLRPDDPASEAAPVPGSSIVPTASRAAAPSPSPRLSAAPSTVAPGAVVPGPTARPSGSPVRPVGPVATSAPVSVPATPAPTVTTAAPPAEPVERTFSSAGGSVRATCPSGDVAQILSATATKPYRVTRSDTEAGPAPTVTFTHGNRDVTMTVTCSGGVPSAAGA